MTRSGVNLYSWATWNSSAPSAGNAGFMCPPNSADLNSVDYRILRLMQEREYIVQDTCPPHQRFKAAPHWHMSKDMSRRYRQSSWSTEKADLVYMKFYQR